MASARQRRGAGIKTASVKPPAGKTAAAGRPASAKIPAARSAFAKPRAWSGSFSAKQRERKNAVLLFVPFVVFLMLSLLLIGLRMSVGRLAKEIAELEAKVAQVQDENNRYLARAEQLASYSRISRLAQERLGLVGLAPKLIVVPSE